MHARTDGLCRQQDANPHAQSASASRALHLLDPVYYRYQAYADLEAQRAQSQALAQSEEDPDMRALAEDEAAELTSRLSEEQDKLRGHLLRAYDVLFKAGVGLIKARSSSDMIKADVGAALTGTREVGPGVEPEGVIVECRPGVGGGEAGLFCCQVARMLQKFADNAGWTVDVMSAVPMEVSTTTQTNADAMKEVVMQFTDPLAGQDGRVNIYERMRWEGGVHRVQRVPITQSTGKLQTSTMAAVVLPIMPEPTEKSDEFYIDPKEVKTETMRASGAGGQHVNKTESAIRLTHEPTGTVVRIEDSRSQHQNRAKAWLVLRARLAERARQAESADNVAMRIEQVQTMDRWDRIRTYNFPQSRVTDHRAGMSVSNIGSFMAGDFDGDWENPRGNLAMFMEECRRLDHEQKLAQIQSLYKQVLHTVYRPPESTT